MRFFGLKTCDTCRKALKSIREKGLDVTVIDVRADGISREDQSMIITQFGDAALNKASTTWRNLSEDEKGQDVAQLLSAYPTLMKRPVIENAGVWSIGWKPDVKNQVLGE